MPHFPMNTGTFAVQQMNSAVMEDHRVEEEAPRNPPASIQVKNRRKRYLELHPEYFSSALELADPLLYDRLIRRFQSPDEREAEGRVKGHSGALEADLMRAELKMEALAHPDPNATYTYTRGPNGEILSEEEDEIPPTKDEGAERWRWEMEMRFMKGLDEEFDYYTVDQCDDYDDLSEEQEKYFEEEDPEWVMDRDANGQIKGELHGETGVQDF